MPVGINVNTSSKTWNIESSKLEWLVAFVTIWLTYIKLLFLHYPIVGHLHSSAVSTSHVLQVPCFRLRNRWSRSLLIRYYYKSEPRLALKLSSLVRASAEKHLAVASFYCKSLHWNNFVWLWPHFYFFDLFWLKSGQNISGSWCLC